MRSPSLVVSPGPDGRTRRRPGAGGRRVPRETRTPPPSSICPGWPASRAAASWSSGRMPARRPPSPASASTPTVRCAAPSSRCLVSSARGPGRPSPPMPEAASWWPGNRMTTATPAASSRNASMRRARASAPPFSPTAPPRATRCGRRWRCNAAGASSWCGRASGKTAAVGACSASGSTAPAGPPEESSASTRRPPWLNSARPWAATKPAASWWPGRATRRTATGTECSASASTPTAHARERSSRSIRTRSAINTSRACCPSPRARSSSPGAVLGAASTPPSGAAVRRLGHAAGPRRAHAHLHAGPSVVLAIDAARSGTGDFTVVWDAADVRRGRPAVRSRRRAPR